MRTLRPGETIRLTDGGEPHRVVLVNESRAYVVPVALVRVEVHTISGRNVTFTRMANGVSICPTAEVERV